MFSQPSSITFEVPLWVEEYCQQYTATMDRGARMRWVIKASQKNVEEQTGGPFAAAVFEAETGKLLSLGVNLVTTQGMSILHAEIVALSIAQNKCGSYDLSEGEGAPYELLSSAEPCAMCLGSIPWSGVRYVATAALEEDMREIGFDEGEKPKNWVQSLTDRGIAVSTNIERDLARSVLQLYSQNNGPIYNPG